MTNPNGIALFENVLFTLIKFRRILGFYLHPAFHMYNYSFGQHLLLLIMAFKFMRKFTPGLFKMPIAHPMVFRNSTPNP